ncbi:conserved hypothetical protein [Histoplasma capsulatum var. duboisii H88]|uniref:Rhodopsin domain-containing protein n=1 Tax=Ajellomyces capsulatus (strain H88) TaxID=544711 RepID=F0U9Z5_AJEC8|nr:conserved hypothetical protein [Histoplasma capsulatum var. duboisii H88]
MHWKSFGILCGWDDVHYVNKFRILRTSFLSSLTGLSFVALTLELSSDLVLTDAIARIVTRMYSSSAPDELTRWDVIPTLLVSWWCTGCSLAIIFVRVIGRYLRTQVLFPEDWIMLASVIPLLIRMGLVHLVLIYGTNNVIATNLSDIQIRQREIGSGLVLGARIFYSLFIWTAKYTITEFLTRLTAQTWRRSFQLMLNFIRLFLVATFAAVAISTLAECQPFHNYWQVNPMPEPKCRQGYAHLVAMGACDAATDMLLVAFPIPIIVVSTMSIFRKLALTLLFALSLILVVITCYRVPAVIQRQGNQQYRSLFASLEIVVATAISNAIVIGSFMRDRGVKKQKYKIGSVSEASDQKFSRRATITNHEWGSDADLATDIGPRLDLEVNVSSEQVRKRGVSSKQAIRNSYSHLTAYGLLSSQPLNPDSQDHMMDIETVIFLKQSPIYCHQPQGNSDSMTSRRTGIINSCLEDQRQGSGPSRPVRGDEDWAGANQGSGKLTKIQSTRDRTFESPRA